MSAVSRWASIRPVEPSNQPNPNGGTPPGMVPVARPEGSMAVNGMRASDWHPTVVNLLVLILLELVAYATLRYVFRTALGA